MRSWAFFTSLSVKTWLLLHKVRWITYKNLETHSIIIIACILHFPSDKGLNILKFSEKLIYKILLFCNSDSSRRFVQFNVLISHNRCFSFAQNKLILQYYNIFCVKCFFHWQQITQHCQASLSIVTAMTFFTLRHVHMPTAHVHRAGKEVLFIQPKRKTNLIS